MDVVTVLWPVGAGVGTSHHLLHDAAAVVEASQQRAATFVRIGILAVAAQGFVIALLQGEHVLLRPPRLSACVWPGTTDGLPDRPGKRCAFPHPVVSMAAGPPRDRRVSSWPESSRRWRRRSARRPPRG